MPIKLCPEVITIRVGHCVFIVYLNITCALSVIEFLWSVCNFGSELLSVHLSVPLLHGPDGDDETTPDAEHPSQLPQRPNPALCRREVVNHSHGEHSIEALVPERQGQVIAQQHLQTGHKTTDKLNSEHPQCPYPGCQI